MTLSWRQASTLSIAMLLGGLANADQAEGEFSREQLEVMAGGCASCHGTDGRLAGAVPAIAGRPAALLEARMLAFKADEVEDTTVMNRIARGFSEEELAALARHLAEDRGPQGETP